jgi:hypothetical protein
MAAPQQPDPARDLFIPSPRFSAGKQVFFNIGNNSLSSWMATHQQPIPTCDLFISGPRFICSEKRL